MHEAGAFAFGMSKSLSEGLDQIVSERAHRGSFPVCLIAAAMPATAWRSEAFRSVPADLA